MNQDIWKFGLRIAGLAAYGKAGGLARVQKLLNLTKLLCYTK